MPEVCFSGRGRGLLVGGGRGGGWLRVSGGVHGTPCVGIVRWAPSLRRETKRLPVVISTIREVVRLPARRALCRTANTFKQKRPWMSSTALAWLSSAYIMPLSAKEK